MDSKSPIILDCPNCGCMVYIEKLNCGIFRHGVIKTNGKCMDPHLDKIGCDALISKNNIYGCGRPFKVTFKEDKFIAEICEYV